MTVNVPDGPNGATTATVFNLNPAFFGSAFQNNIRDNQAYLDTAYNGVEFTATKRFSHRWQMVAGLTIGKNEGGLTGSDLNDPNITRFPTGVIGDDSKVAFRMSGSYNIPGDVLVAGSLVSNGGYPIVSTYNLTRAASGGILTRSSQTILLSDRGDERLPTVTLIDLRVSRAFKFAQNRRISPQIDFFNIGNASTVVGLTTAVGGSYKLPTQIVAPRIIRVGFSVDF